MKKKIVAALLATSLAATLIGCGKGTTDDKADSEKASETVAVSETTEETETEESVDGMARSNLTGEWIDENLASKRPIALMVENTYDAWPHYGIEKADIIYESPVEGKITRYMAVFQDYSDMERIGNVRSARTYYVAWADEYNAIFCHYGYSIFAYDILQTLDELDGLNGTVDSLMFYRASDMKNPHNAYTSTDGINAAIANAGFETELADGYGEHFNFNHDDNSEVELSDGAYDAVVVAPGYQIDNPWFVYNESDGLYYRYAFKRAETDAVTGNQLTCKNIILQDVDYTLYTGSGTKFDNTYLNIDYMSGGKGQYITNGKAVDITWTKESQDSPTRYWDADGNEIQINQGKTWVCIVVNEDADRVAFYSSEADFENAQ